MPGQVRSNYTPRIAPRPLPTPVTAPAASTSNVVQTQGKDAPIPAPALPAVKPTQDLFDGYVRLETPGREKVFGARETEKELEARFSQLEKDAGREKIVFPEKPAVTTDNTPFGRNLAPQVMPREPAYVVYRRLYFEEKNSERYGWNAGPVLQPLISTAWFANDAFFFPKHLTSYNCRRFDTNAGLCWPGDPVPYLLYPPEFTMSGTLLESALVIGMFAAIP